MTHTNIISSFEFLMIFFVKPDIVISYSMAIQYQQRAPVIVKQYKPFYMYDHLWLFSLCFEIPSKFFSFIIRVQ